LDFKDAANHHAIVKHVIVLAPLLTGSVRNRGALQGEIVFFHQSVLRRVITACPGLNPLRLRASLRVRSGSSSSANLATRGSSRSFSRLGSLTRLLLLLPLFQEQVIQGGIDLPLVNVEPLRTVEGHNPISPVFPYDLDTVERGALRSVVRGNEI
jgi:hypothetical protein